MNYDTMSAHDLVLDLQESMRKAVVMWKPINLHQREELESALRKAVIREASVTWTRKYSLANASGVSCLVGKFPNGYRLDLENADIPDGDYDLIPKETP